MKHRQILVLAGALAAGVLFVQAAAAARGGGIAHGTIGKTAPSPTAATAIRRLGSDDESSSDDDGGFLRGGRVAHGTIGNALPHSNAAPGIRSLGLDD
jgi:hypothetical protein